MYLPFAAAPPSARTISRQTIYFFSLKAHMPPDLQKKKKPPLHITAHTTLVSPCGPHFPRLRAGRSIAPQLFLHPPLDLEDMAGSPTSGRHYPGSRATAILSPSHRRCPPPRCEPGSLSAHSASRQDGWVPSPGPLACRGLSPGWLMHCWMLSRRVEARARASSAKRRCPSSVNFQRQERGRALAPACMLTGTFSKLSRKQRLCRTVFFQPSGAVRKKGKCCLWTGKNGQESTVSLGEALSSHSCSPPGARSLSPSLTVENGKLAQKKGSLLTEHVAKPDLVRCLCKPHLLNPVYCFHSQAHFPSSL